MAAPRFVHLRLHSEFSIVDGTVRVDDGIAAALADAMPALAITDLANTFGLVKFYRAARARGIKPVIGCDVWLTHEAERDQPFRALLLAQSRAGFLRLAEWLTRAYRTNQHRGRAELRRDWLREGTDGLIALSGARDGEVGAALLQGNPPGAAKAARAWSDLFPGRYYLEVQRAGRPDDDTLVAATAALASELALPVVATHPVQFLRREDFRAHEARVCIAGGHVLADARRPRPFTPEQYFKTQSEMAAAFADLPEALANAVAVAQRCNVTIPLGKNFLPDFPTPPAVTLDEHLRNEAAAGLERRLAVLYPDPATRDAKRPDYVARLEFETSTIVQMGFAGYFLIVADFINWAKSDGVPVGPGRGSGAGLARRLRARHHRSRSDALRPRVRAPAESRARVDAGSRHRLLPERPRPRHRIRQEEIRRRLGVADRDVRHDGREGRGARRRPRARPAVPLLRRHREAHPVPAGEAGHAARGADDGAAPGRARAEGGGGARAPRAGRGARGAHPQRRHARRRRADRAGQAHRLLPAVHAGGVGRDRVAVRQGRRRGDRARQVRLSRPHDAHDPRLDAALREAPRSRERPEARDACRSTTRPPTTSSSRPTRRRCSSSNRAACAISSRTRRRRGSRTSSRSSRSIGRGRWSSSPPTRRARRAASISSIRTGGSSPS